MSGSASLNPRANREFNIVAVTCDAANLLAISGFVVYKLLRQKTTTSIWLQICALWLAYACMLVRDSLVVAGAVENADLLNKANTLANFFYLGQHWVFAFDYLKVALIFKLAFSFKDEQVTVALSRRVKSVNLVSAVILLAMLILNLLLLIAQESSSR